MWRMLDVLRFALHFIGDLEHGGRECIECLDALGLGRLDHQRLGHDQREIDRWGVEAEVEQALGDVHGTNTALLLPCGR